MKKNILFFDSVREKRAFIKSLQKSPLELEDYTKNTDKQIMLFVSEGQVSCFTPDPIDLAFFFKDAYEADPRYEDQLLHPAHRGFYISYHRMIDSGKYVKASRYRKLAKKFGRI